MLKLLLQFKNFTKQKKDKEISLTLYWVTRYDYAHIFKIIFQAFFVTINLTKEYINNHLKITAYG